MPLEQSFPALTRSPAVRAIGLRAVRVERERVVLQRKTALLGDQVLTALDLGIEELLDVSALQAYEVVVMVPFVEFVDRLA